MDMMSLRRRVMVNQNKLMTATGNPITFNMPLTKPLKECVVRFTPQQEGSGTPSPDNVRNISGRNSVKLWQSGKNLFNKASAKMGRYESVEGVWTLVENAVWYASDLIRVKPNTRYSMFGGTPLASVGAYINVYDEDMTRVNYTTHLSYIDTTANAKYLSVHSTGTGSFYKNRDTIMICEGSDVPSEYEPYTGNEITFTFPSTVGDNGVVYGGYVDLVNGEVVAEWYKVPTSAFVKYRQNNGYIAYRYEAPDYASGIPWLCNLIGEYGSFSTSNMTKNIIQSSRVGGKIYLALDETVDINTLQIVFPLEEPIHYPIPSRILTTLRGNNVMWSDANGDLTVKYWTR